MSLIDTLCAKFNVNGGAKKIIKNVYWALLGKVVQLFGNLLVGILIARYLGPEQFGLMSYIISYVGLYSVLASFGMENIEIRELSRHHDRKDVILGTSTTLRIIFSLVTIAVIFLTTLTFEADWFVISMIMIYALSMVLNSLSGIRNYFTSIVLNEYIVKTEIARTVIGAGIKVVLLLLHASLPWFIMALTFDCLLIASGYLFSYQKKVGSIRDWSFDKATAWYLVKQSFPLLLSGAAVVVYQNINQVMIGNMIDKESVSYFSVAGRFVEIALVIPVLISQTVAPILVRIRGRSEEEYRSKGQLYMNVVVWSSIFISIVVSLASYWVIAFTFGEKYLLAVPVLKIMIFKTVCMALSTTSGQLIIIEGIHLWTVIRNLVGCISCVCLNYLLIPHLGVIGSAWATVMTVLFSGFISNLLIPRYIHIFKMQIRTLTMGWMDIFRIRLIINRMKQS